MHNNIMLWLVVTGRAANWLPVFRRARSRAHIKQTNRWRDKSPFKFLNLTPVHFINGRARKLAACVLPLLLRTFETD